MIVLSHVSKSYGSLLLFEDVNAAFDAGHVHLVTGRNGSGKSTLLRMIAGLCGCTSGSITFSREDIRTGYLGHSTFLYPGLSALDNLAFWQKTAGLPAPRKHLLDALDHVGLLPFAHTRTAVFSRGMAQRLSLARVLLTVPDIFLLDEPETGLDSLSRTLLQYEVIRAAKRGACVLWVTHQCSMDTGSAIVYTVRNRGLYVAADPGGRVLC